MIGGSSRPTIGISTSMKSLKIRRPCDGRRLRRWSGNSAICLGHQRNFFRADNGFG